MVCDKEPRSSSAPTPPTRSTRRLPQSKPAEAPKALRKRSPRRVAPGSVLGIMRRHAGASLFLRPLYWTDKHAELLGAQFNELPICDAPVPVNEPGSPPSKGHMQPSKTITILSDTLTDILSDKIAPPVVLSNAVRTVMATLWPSAFCRSILFPDLSLYFGDKIYPEAVVPQIMWTSPGDSFLSPQLSWSSSQSTQSTDSQPESQPQRSPTPCHNTLAGYPMICYIGKPQVASIRRNMFRIPPGPNGRFNGPVYRLHKLRSRNLEPRNADEDSHIVGVMLAMAQKHFYNPQRPGVSPAKDAKPFRDLKLRVMTHDSETAEFIVYTGHITATFLERFRRPHRVPRATDFGEDLGLKIDYARVPIWPILGLRERLGKALGEDVVGAFEPDAMETWEQDAVETPKSSGRKRKRAALAELVNSSFDESDEEQSPVSSKKPCIRRGPPLQAVA